MVTCTIQSWCVADSTVRSNLNSDTVSSTKYRRRSNVPPTVDSVARSRSFILYGEVGGPAVSLLSLHAEATLYRFDTGSPPLSLCHTIRASVGSTIAPFTQFAFPVSAKILFFRSSSHLEVGLGTTFLLPEIQSETAYLFEDLGTRPIYHLIVGYRYEPPRGGFTFRLAYTPYYTSKPLITAKGPRHFIFFWGISIGQAF